MGFGGSASETIFFIGAVVMATAFVGVAVTVVGSFSSDLKDRGQQLSAQLRADVRIINDPMNVPTTPLTLYVKNTGQVSLLVVDTTVLVDGRVSTNTTYDVLDSSDDESWAVGQVLECRVHDIAATSGDHRARVSAQFGARHDLEFYVP